MSNETTLLTCPFCGGEAEAVHEISGFWTVECVECGALVDGIAAWNARAELGSEPPYDELLRCLENDWHIHASWDGLRKFWCVELTEEGVRMRDARAERGTLTAEQVREAVEKHWHDLPAEYDMPEATALPEYSYDWQAIADELNARAERTCEFVDDSDSEPSPPKCSACGYDPGIYECAWYEDGTYGYERNYCPNCGARVVA